MYTCLSVCLHVCLYICLPACQPDCPPACLSACLPSCLPVCLPICLPACMRTSCLSIVWRKLIIIQISSKGNKASKIMSFTGVTIFCKSILAFYSHHFCCFKCWRKPFTLCSPSLQNFHISERKYTITQIKFPLKIISYEMFWQHSIKTTKHVI